MGTSTAVSVGSRRRIAVVALVLCGAAGCSQAVGPIAYDSVPPTQTYTIPLPVTTEPEVVASTEPPLGAAGEDWTPVVANLAGMSSECGNVSVIPAPDGSTLYAGIALQGLFRSTGNGADWEPLGVGEGSATITNRLSAIVFDPADPDRWWTSGTYNGPGVYRTDDGGVTFQPLGDIIHVEGLGVDMTDPDRLTLVATVHETTKILVSRDGGGTWTDTSASLPPGIGQLLAPLVLGPNEWLLGSTSAEGSGIFRTTDGGASWIQVMDGEIIGAPLRASDGSFYWLLRGGRGIAVSRDAGVTWTQFTSGRFSNTSLTVTEVPGVGIAAIGSDARVIVSTDHGESWRRVGPTTPWLPSGVAFLAADQAFYTWKYDCDLSVENNPVAADAIERLPFVPAELTEAPGTTVAEADTTVAGPGTTLEGSGTTVADTGTTVADPGTTVADTATTVASTTQD